MSEETKKAPAIRFQGFTDDWEQRKLGDTFEFSVSTNSLSRAQLNYEKGNIKSIHYGDILIKYNSILEITKDKIPFITDGSIEKYKPNLLENGDVVFADAAEDETVGKAVEINGISDEYVVAGLHTIVARPKEKMAKYFSGYYINADVYQRQLLRLMQGTKVSSISKGNLKKTIVAYPKNLAEQQKIGSFFKQLDNAIALHQRQLDNYKQLKKSMKQKIFDQKLRFKDADGNDYPKWKRRTLGEISEIIMGQSPDSANYTSNEQDTVLIQGNADLNGGRITPRIYTTQITKTCEAGDIILTVRAPVGDLAIANTRACIGRGVCAIKGDLYIYQYLEMIRDTDGWRKIIQGSTFESINSNDVKDLPIDVPSSEERKKIAEFFKALDRRIEKSTQRVESMKQFRKGLMQQMFVE